MAGRIGDLEWAPIPDAPFGIDVMVDPATELGSEQRDALRSLYARDGLLRLRSAEPLSTDAQAEFCRIFGAVLSPDYNAAHANHFHFDMGYWMTCR